MSEFELEIGKKGLEIEAKGKALFWIVALTFVAGLGIGSILGFKLRDKGGEIVKKMKKKE